MKNFLKVLPLVMLLSIMNTFAQDLQILVPHTELTDTLGADIVFDFDIINISSIEQTVFEVRTINDLPDNNWQSSLCFGENCFAPFVDSVATTPEFLGAEPLQPGDTLITSLHISSFSTTGTANVQVQVGTFANPDNRFTLDFTAHVVITDVTDSPEQPKEFSLLQNFPNPFNPSTKIKFNVAKTGNVKLIVYNILGKKVATLVNEVKTPGSYSVNFNSAKFKELSSGIYFYQLVTNDYIQTKKMILEK